MDEKLFINELGQKIGVNDLALNANNSCSFACENSIITIQFQPQDETFLIYSPIVSHSDDEDFDMEIYKSCLAANLFGHGTLGMHLGYFAPLSSIVLSATKETKELHIDDMINFLNFFTEETLKWKNKITNTSQEKNSTDVTSEAKPQEFLLRV